MAKYCGQCGAPLREEDRFCPSCGQPVPAGTSAQTGSQGQNSWSQPQNSWNQPQNSWNQPQNSWNQPQNSQPRDPWDRPQQTNWGAPQADQPTMKWFKFIIWVQLFLSALANLGQGAEQIATIIYEDYASTVYFYFPAMRILDIIYILLIFAYAVAALFVRSQLVQFKRQAPAIYLGFFAANYVISLLYTLLVSAIIHSFAGDLVLLLAYAVIEVVYIVLNSVYFKKRRHLFVN